MDEHVPDAVAQALRRRGIDVTTSAGVGLLGASDMEHLVRALAEGRVVVTHDRDFLRIHREGRLHAGIAYCDQGTRTIGDLVASLMLIYEIMEPAEMVGRLEFI